MAEQSDVVVMCLGLDATIEGEEGDAGNEYASGDKLGLMLPGLQEELLEAVAAVESGNTCAVSRKCDRSFMGRRACGCHYRQLVSGSQRRKGCCRSYIRRV
ncbi:MAG: hypothetical protein ACLRI8_01945 [Agathobacter rectalis]